ncbi:MAG: hypothetical protein P8X96_04135 [Desulfobacteraceae bacterium]
MTHTIKYEKPVGILMILCGYMLALLGGMVGLLIGSRLLAYNMDNTGQRIYLFDEPSRRHGKIMVVLASIVILFGMVLNISLKA